MEEFMRTKMLLGENELTLIRNSSVAVFGIGGVGSYAVEALVRCGVGELLLVDNDIVSLSNINRQIIALHSTVGQYKTDVMKQRIEDINPSCKVTTANLFYAQAEDIDISNYNYIIDAIDTVSSKLTLISEANRLGIPIISSMGTGNKLDASKFKITDIKNTSVCPLARVMRRELKSRGINSLKVLFSDESPIAPKIQLSDGSRRQIPSSISFVPSVAGLLIAGEVIRDLIK